MSKIKTSQEYQRDGIQGILFSQCSFLYSGGNLESKTTKQEFSKLQLHSFKIASLNKALSEDEIHSKYIAKEAARLRKSEDFKVLSNSPIRQCTDYKKLKKKKTNSDNFQSHVSFMYFGYSQVKTHLWSLFPCCISVPVNTR